MPEFPAGIQNYVISELRPFGNPISPKSPQGIPRCRAAKDPLQAPAVLQVTFSCHVYSEKWDDTKHSPESRFDEDGQPRAFCTARYGCSIGLETLIRYHIAGKAYWGKDGNGVTNSFFYGEADGIAYPVYFRLGTANKIKGADGILHVISAYQNPELPARHRFQAVKFARLVHQKCPSKRETASTS